MKSAARILLLLAAIYAGVYLVPHMLVTGPAEHAAYEHDVTGKKAEIETAINTMLAATDGACVSSRPYVVPAGAAVTGPFTGADASYLPRTCDRCDDLAAAGLLEKKVTETRSDTGATSFASRFTLTPFGREVYVEDVRPAGDAKGELVEWKFCFGETRLHHIDEALPAMMLGGNTYVGVKYTSEVVNPHPFLFDPKSKPLRLAVPTNAKPALNPPKVTTIVFYPDNGRVEVDDSFRYGKFVDQ